MSFWDESKKKLLTKILLLSTQKLRWWFVLRISSKNKKNDVETCRADIWRERLDVCVNLTSIVDWSVVREFSIIQLPDVKKIQRQKRALLTNFYLLSWLWNSNLYLSCFGTLSQSRKFLLGILSNTLKFRRSRMLFGVGAKYE